MSAAAVSVRLKGGDYQKNGAVRFGDGGRLNGQIAVEEIRNGYAAKTGDVGGGIIENERVLSGKQAGRIESHPCDHSIWRDEVGRRGRRGGGDRELDARVSNRVDFTENRIALTGVDSKENGTWPGDIQSGNCGCRRWRCSIWIETQMEVQPLHLLVTRHSDHDRLIGRVGGKDMIADINYQGCMSRCRCCEGEQHGKSEPNDSDVGKGGVRHCEVRLVYRLAAIRSAAIRSAAIWVTFAGRQE